MSSTNAVVFDLKSRSVKVQAVALPELGPFDVLVEAGVVGLCRSDNELLEGHLDEILDLPQQAIPGHEWSGTVVNVGTGVTHLSVGDRVVGECVLSDGLWFGFNYDGAAAEQFVAPSRLLHKVPESFSLTQAALIEPFTIAYNAFDESGGCDASQVVTVIGGGMVGLCSVAIAKAKGATVICVEPNAKRRELARTLGADLAVGPDAIEDVESFYSQFGVVGADLVIEASGHPAGVASTFSHVAYRGRVTNIGICAAEVNGPIGLIQAKNLVVRGVTGSTGVWPRAIRFLQRTGIDLSPVVSSRFDYTDAHRAMQMTDAADSIKVHLSFEKSAR